MGIPGCYMNFNFPGMAFKEFFNKNGVVVFF